MGALEEAMERVADLAGRCQGISNHFSQQEAELTRLRKYGESVQLGEVTAVAADLTRATGIMDGIEAEIILVSGVFNRAS